MLVFFSLMLVFFFANEMLLITVTSILHKVFNISKKKVLSLIKDDYNFLSEYANTNLVHDNVALKQ